MSKVAACGVDGPAPRAKRRMMVPKKVLEGRWWGSSPRDLNELKVGPVVGRWGVTVTCRGLGGQYPQDQLSRGMCAFSQAACVRCRICPPKHRRHDTGPQATKGRFGALIQSFNVMFCSMFQCARLAHAGALKH
jgi:hypothetical protein